MTFLFRSVSTTDSNRPRTVSWFDQLWRRDWGQGSGHQAVEQFDEMKTALSALCERLAAAPHAITSGIYGWMVPAVPGCFLSELHALAVAWPAGGR
ncbi:MAG: hypothetical protein QOH34_888 [Mycobacterium sp.]|nr:hypothetical protein [Mycobacterium sp.]